MKLLYESSPKQFEELLVTLTNADISVGPAFRQQTKNVNSIPDLEISQKSFSVFFETKLDDWFYEDQIHRHIEGLHQSDGTKILFLLSNFEDDDLAKKFKSVIAKAEERHIVVCPLTFEDFVAALEQVCTSEYLKNLLEEFREYLDSKELLPAWKHLLDVVSCPQRISNEIEAGGYICPDAGGAYRHRRAKYFGAYSDKTVKAIYEIKAVIVVGKDSGETTIKWKNVTEENEHLIEEAKAKVQKLQERIDENKSAPLQVFLLDKKAETNFIKDTSGGMLNLKKYFWDIAKDCKNSEELAEKLRDQSWSDFSNGK
ncbi:hypothetical protein FACS189419_09350 [Planctomycetales bacterium]|nr:hypothetical protein FACS189419_09350 [Planctomycetales bacterium]